MVSNADVAVCEYIMSYRFEVKGRSCSSKSKYPTRFCHMLFSQMCDERIKSSYLVLADFVKFDRYFVHLLSQENWRFPFYNFCCLLQLPSRLLSFVASFCSSYI